MDTTVESIVWSDISSTPAVFTLRGGQYALTIHAATWGTATLQRRAADNVTYVTVLTAFSADGFQNVKLPAGIYQLTLSGVSGLYGDLTTIVTQVMTQAMLGTSNVLLSDSFNRGSAGTPLNGQAPDIGPVWLTAGMTGADMVTSGGQMFQNAAGSAGYATSTTSAMIGEVGCNFRLTVSSSTLVFSTTGPVAVNYQIGSQIWPSGATDFTEVSYTLTAADTLTSAATKLAALITANTTLAAAGVSATASTTGSDATVTMVATQAPRVNPFAIGANIGVAASQIVQPTLACYPIYPTGTDFLTAVLHFYLGVDGSFFWGFFSSDNPDGTTPFSTLNSKIQGLSPNVVYTYRCCIAAPYAWGGLWEGSTLIGAVWAQDPGIAVLQGPCCFFETGVADTGIPALYYDDAWAYQTPSVSLASIQAFVGS